jgi:hypothetical protein
MNVVPEDRPFATPLQPYQGLSYFAEDDATFFFGRERERTTIASNLRTSRLTVLFAPSGGGKTSVVRAGVVARLRESAHRDFDDRGAARFIPVVFTSWRDDPVVDLIDAVASAIEPFILAGNTGGLPRSDLAGALEVAGVATSATLLIILDQFEEHLLYRTVSRDPGRFADNVAACISRRDLRANFLIVVRDDAYARLGELFAGRRLDIYANRVDLRPLDRAAAADAIVRPLDRLNRDQPQDEPFVIEPELVDAVLDQTSIGRVSLPHLSPSTDREVGVESTQEIETPYLQLVMAALWQRELEMGSRVLRRQTLADVGGSDEIVGTHVDRALDDLTTSDQDAAADVFTYLVTPSGAKIAQSVEDLAAYTGRPPDEVLRVVHMLSSGNRRILRPVPPRPGETGEGVELFHHVLALPVLEWRQRRTAVRAQSQARRAEREAIRQRRRALVLIGVAVAELIAIVVLAIVALR